MSDPKPPPAGSSYQNNPCKVFDYIIDFEVSTNPKVYGWVDV